MALPAALAKTEISVALLPSCLGPGLGPFPQLGSHGAMSQVGEQAPSSPVELFFSAGVWGEAVQSRLPNPESGPYSQHVL